MCSKNRGLKVSKLVAITDIFKRSCPETKNIMISFDIGKVKFEISDKHTYLSAEEPYIDDMTFPQRAENVLIPMNVWQEKLEGLCSDDRIYIEKMERHLAIRTNDWLVVTYVNLAEGDYSEVRKEIFHWWRLICAIQKRSVTAIYLPYYGLKKAVEYTCGKDATKLHRESLPIHLPYYELKKAEGYTCEKEASRLHRESLLLLDRGEYDTSTITTRDSSIRQRSHSCQCFWAKHDGNTLVIPSYLFRIVNQYSILSSTENSLLKIVLGVDPIYMSINGLVLCCCRPA